MDNWCNHAGGCVENTWYGALIGAAIVIGVLLLGIWWTSRPPKPPKQELTWNDLPPKKRRQLLLAQADELERDAKVAKSAEIGALLREAAAKRRRRADEIVTQPHDAP
jgi:hypothetical protein